jgi:hypothetical protein
LPLSNCHRCLHCGIIIAVTVTVAIAIAITIAFAISAVSVNAIIIDAHHCCPINIIKLPLSNRPPQIAAIVGIALGPWANLETVRNVRSMLLLGNKR